MALAAVAFAKAMRRRQIMVATSSIGPGATNMVTAAAVAHANRLPVLLLSGDTFASRIPDPVLQQVESFHDPSATVNDSFKPVTRFWDRIVKPEQVVALAAPRGGDDARPGHLRAGLPRPAPGRPGRGLRLPGPVLRAGAALVPPAASRHRAAGPGRRRALPVPQAAHRRRRRRALLAGRGCAAHLRRAPQHPGRRDRRRQGHAGVGPPAQRRPHRLDRLHVGQRDGRRGRRRPRRGDPPAGLHHGLVDGVRQRGREDHRAQHRHVRRGEAPRAAARGGRPGGPVGARRPRSATGGARTSGPTRPTSRSRSTTRTSTRSPAPPRRRRRSRTRR